MHRPRGASIALQSLAAWGVVLALAVGNGALREALLVPALGRTAALVLSGVLLSIFIVLVAVLFVRRLRGLSVAHATGIGVLWLGLTLAFEFAFGRFVQHKAWAELLDAYTFRDGNLWPVVLLVTLLAPALAARSALSGRARTSATTRSSPSARR